MILTKDKHQIAMYLQIPHVNSILLDVGNNHRINYKTTDIDKR